MADAALLIKITRIARLLHLNLSSSLRKTISLFIQHPRHLTLQNLHAAASQLLDLLYHTTNVF